MSPNSIPEALHDHLIRLLGAGAVSILLGGARVWRRPKWTACGGINAAWGFVDVAVGITMVSLAGDRRAVKGSGLAVVVQGAVLLALDGALLYRLA